MLGQAAVQAQACERREKGGRERERDARKGGHAKIERAREKRDKGRACYKHEASGEGVGPERGKGSNRRSETRIERAFAHTADERPIPAP